MNKSQQQIKQYLEKQTLSFLLIGVPILVIVVLLANIVYSAFWIMLTAGILADLIDLRLAQLSFTESVGISILWLLLSVSLGRNDTSEKSVSEKVAESLISMPLITAISAVAAQIFA